MTTALAPLLGTGILQPQRHTMTRARQQTTDGSCTVTSKWQKTSAIDQTWIGATIARFAQAVQRVALRGV